MVLNIHANNVHQIEYFIQVSQILNAFANMAIMIFKVNLSVLIVIVIVNVVLQQMFIAYHAMMETI